TTAWPGVSFALGAAVLFGASTPFAMLLLGEADPVLLAGLLYLGSGIGLTGWAGLRSRARETVRGSEPPSRGPSLAGGSDPLRGRGRPGAAHDRPVPDTGLVGFLAPQPRRGPDRPAGLARVQGERGPTHRRWHSGHHGRGRGAVVGRPPRSRP